MDIKIGKVTHFYNHISVAVLELTGEMRVGDRIVITGHSTEFNQQVESMEIDHRKIQSAGPGQEVALKVWEAVREGDLVYKVIDE